MLANFSSRSGVLVPHLVLAAGAILLTTVLSCGGGNTTPFALVGPAVSGNLPPTMTITSPDADLSVAQGGTFTIQWSDQDTDSAAQISFDLVSATDGTTVIPLVDGLPENDSDADGRPTAEEFIASTTVVAPGEYFIRGTIRDDINAPVQVFALTNEAAPVRVVLTVTRTGFAPPSTPPVIVVTQPAFNLSVAQDDQLLINVQPTEEVPDAADADAPDPTPYDRDSDATLYLLLDVDDDPTNDDPANPDSDEIIVLFQTTVLEGTFDPIEFTDSVDLGLIPVRADGSPYYVRATIQDEANDPVHAYANGVVNVAQPASGSVDLGQVGRTFLGATFQGFNPGSRLGSRMISARDFDNDGIEDFILVAQFGNPRNLGNIGEAYLLYGLDQQRFGGSLNVNATSRDLPGVIFEAPFPRYEELEAFPGFEGRVEDPRTDGLTDVAVIGDLSGDGRPELIFGMGHVDGVFQGRDDDPGDDPPEADDTVQVEVVLRQGSKEVTVGSEDPVTGSYSGFEDTIIKSASPNSNFGTSAELEWDDDGADEKVWTLIRMKDVLDALPDSRESITDISANLVLRVFNEGDDGTIHECFTTFSESSATYNNFAVAGGDPLGGDPEDEDTDYDEEELGSLDGEVGEAQVDLSELIQKLVDGELDQVNNDVLLIIVPDPDGGNGTQARSSEYAAVTEDRPQLTITYERTTTAGALGCYPDLLPNNFASEDPDEDDAGLEALGVVAIVHSENRDNEGVINPDRLEATVVALELVGQEAGLLGPASFNGLVTQLAEADEASKIAGSRFQVGMYDSIDHLLLNQPPLEGLFGWNVGSIPDLDNDQVDEVIISAPRNERDIQDLEAGGYFPFSTHLASRAYDGSIAVIPGANYNVDFFRDKGGEEGCASIPLNDNQGEFAENPSCDLQNPGERSLYVPFGSFEIFAEDVDDFLSDGDYAGDVNLDGVPDILCGAPLNDSAGEEAGAAYVIYGRTPVGDVDLKLADDARFRPPMLRIRGSRVGDRIGTQQERLGDMNGDRIPDIAISSPTTDFGGIAQTTCGGEDVSTASFEECLGAEVFADDDCKGFDYNNDRMIDEDDRAVLQCLQEGGSDCCPVDNGFVGVVFGGVSLDGDRDISQIGTSDLPGVTFFGGAAGERAGADISSAGDFNQDGFADLLIAAPGRRWEDAGGQIRLGVAYLIFGGPHLENQSFNLSLVGSDDLPGMVLVSPFAEGRPNEAPPDHVGLLGDINNDGFDDIAIGNTRADFIDETLPQVPGDPGTDPATGRRPDAGEIYVVYGNNFGSNR